MTSTQRLAKRGKEGAQAPELTASAYAASMQARWAQVDALMGGSEAMREQSKTLLPKHAAEDNDTYANRVARSWLLPVFAQTIEALTGAILQTPIGDEVNDDDDYRELLDNVNGRGDSLTVFAAEPLGAAMQKGEVYLLVDSQNVASEEVKTKADEKRLKLRPYMRIIPADNMLAFELDDDAVETTVTYARWYEQSYRQKESSFESERVETVWEWRPGERKKHVRVDGGAFTQHEIPDRLGRVTIHRMRLGTPDSAGRLLPPLNGLAEKNIEHWQSASDQRAILTISRFPMLGGSGVSRDDLTTADDGRISVGPHTTFFARDPQSRVYYIEPGGAAIEAGERDLETLMEDMKTLAYQPLMRQQAGVTATRDALQEAKSNSALSRWAEVMEDALTEALKFFALYRSEATPPDLGIEVNKEFGPEVLEDVRISALHAARDRGDLSRRQYLEELQRERALSEEFDIEANDAELEEEVPDAPPLEALTAGEAPETE